MATKAVTAGQTGRGAQGEPALGSITLANWLAMANGDVGAILRVADFPYKDWQITGGVLGAGGSVTMRGSNLENPDPTVAAQWYNLKDAQGNAATLAALGAGGTVGNVPLWLSPIVTAGDGTTSLNIALLARRF